MEIGSISLDKEGIGGHGKIQAYGLEKILRPRTILKFVDQWKLTQDRKNKNDF